MGTADVTSDIAIQRLDLNSNALSHLGNKQVVEASHTPVNEHDRLT